EDGIRDGHVTGVQTCALPISSAAKNSDGSTSRIEDWSVTVTTDVDRLLADDRDAPVFDSGCAAVTVLRRARSVDRVAGRQRRRRLEERRVGQAGTIRRVH